MTRVMDVGMKDMKDMESRKEEKGKQGCFNSSSVYI